MNPSTLATPPQDCGFESPRHGRPRLVVFVGKPHLHHALGAPVLGCLGAPRPQEARVSRMRR